MQRLIAAVLLLSFCACITLWNKPGASQEDFADDQLKCEAHMSMRCAYAYGWGVPVCRANAFDGCMETRGWAKK